MTRLTLDAVRTALPELDELRPIFDHLLARSEPDPTRAWSGSGELGTAGSRLVGDSDLVERVGRLAAEEAATLGELYGHVARALALLAAGDADGAAEPLLAAAALEEGRDRPERAAAYAEAAFRNVRDGARASIKALALRRHARALRTLGDLEEARTRYADAYEIARASGENRAAAEAAVGAGNVLEDQGRWTEAAGWYRKALDALEPIDAPVPERWHALLTLHIVERTGGRIEPSREWLDRAQREVEALGDDAAVPYLENARGQLAMAGGDFERAEQHLRAALEAATDARARVVIRLNLAETLLARGRTLDAKVDAREAEREAIRARLVPKLPEVYRLLGRIASQEGNPDAFVLFERALELVRARRLPLLEEALTLQAYAEAEAKGGDSDAADDLRRQAEERFERLGINHERSAWADVYGPGSHPIEERDGQQP